MTPIFTTGELICDCCDAPLKQDGHMFRCTKCDQIHFFSELGHTTSICARLYPAWKHMRVAMKREAVEFWLRQRELDFHMRLVLHDITEEEYRARRTACEVEAEKIRLEISAAPFVRLWNWIKR